MDEDMLAHVQVGVVIIYRMRLSDRPTNPQRLWHGVVEDVYTGAYMVRLIEPGYEGLKEIVFIHQIVGTDGELRV